MKGNSNIGIRINIFGLVYGTIHYRPQISNLVRFQFINYEVSPISALLIGGTAIDEIYYLDAIHSNCTSNSVFGPIDSFGKVVMRNITLSNIPYSDYATFRVAGADHLEMSNISILNTTGSSSSIVPIIQIENNPGTFTLIQDLKANK